MAVGGFLIIWLLVIVKLSRVAFFDFSLYHVVGVDWIVEFWDVVVGTEEVFIIGFVEIGGLACPVEGEVIIKRGDILFSDGLELSDFGCKTGQYILVGVWGGVDNFQG